MHARHCLFCQPPPKHPQTVPNTPQQPQTTPNNPQKTPKINPKTDKREPHKEGRRVPRSANNPPRPALGVSDHIVSSRSGASYRRRQGRFSKSCSPLEYNGYFFGNMLFYPSARGFRGLPRTSVDFRFGLASPADHPLGDKQNH